LIRRSDSFLTMFESYYSLEKALRTRRYGGKELLHYQLRVPKTKFRHVLIQERGGGLILTTGENLVYIKGGLFKEMFNRKRAPFA